MSDRPEPPCRPPRATTHPDDHDADRLETQNIRILLNGVAAC